MQLDEAPPFRSPCSVPPPARTDVRLDAVHSRRHRLTYAEKCLLYSIEWFVQRTEGYLCVVKPTTGPPRCRLIPFVMSQPYPYLERTLLLFLRGKFATFHRSPGLRVEDFHGEQSSTTWYDMIIATSYNSTTGK